mmetsp:Transcript_37250/g.86607  ORF Transcript_37250/g.86607 Transcript_37250/m.86607 type:complete len:236 (+) Transcript_37250:614-1321(+)
MTAASISIAYCSMCRAAATPPSAVPTLPEVAKAASWVRARESVRLRATSPSRVPITASSSVSSPRQSRVTRVRRSAALSSTLPTSLLGSGSVSRGRRSADSAAARLSAVSRACSVCCNKRDDSGLDGLGEAGSSAACSLRVMGLNPSAVRQLPSPNCRGCPMSSLTILNASVSSSSAPSASLNDRPDKGDCNRPATSLEGEPLRRDGDTAPLRGDAASGRLAITMDLGSWAKRTL